MSTKPWGPKEIREWLEARRPRSEADVPEMNAIPRKCPWCGLSGVLTGEEICRHIEEAHPKEHAQRMLEAAEAVDELVRRGQMRAVVGEDGVTRYAWVDA